jgi:hypothetical protein
MGEMEIREIIITQKDFLDFSMNYGMLYICRNCKNVHVRRYDNYCSKCGIKFKWEINKEN